MSIGALIALPSWPLDFLKDVGAYGAHSDLTSPTGIILGDTPWNTLLDLLLLAQLIFYTWNEWVNGWPHFEELIFLGPIITQSIAPRTATTKQTILLIPLLTWLKRLGNELRLVTMLVLVAAPWMIFVATVRGTGEQPVVYLPVPTYCLAAALMLWIRRSRTETASTGPAAPASSLATPSGYL